MLFFKRKQEGIPKKQIPNGVTKEMQYTAILRYCMSKKGGKLNGNYPRYFEATYFISNPTMMLVEMEQKGLLSKVGEYYHWSELGKEMYQKYDWLFDISSYDISIEDYVSHDKGQGKNSVMWGIIQERQSKDYAEHNFGLVRNNYWDLHQILYSEDKKKQSLRMLIGVIYADLSGWGNGGIQSSDYIYLAPAICKRAFELKEYYSSDMLEDAHIVPSSLLEHSFIEILGRILNGEEINLEDYIRRKNGN